MSQSNDPVRLIAEIDGLKKRVETQSLDVSLNELADMYDAEELVITPDYQRLFRWSSEKQSRFIESLILEMPVPPLFVIEVEEGKWELIDGLQRLSSYLHFRGMLDAPEHPEQPIKKGDELVLTDCDILESVNGMKWGELPTSVAIRLKRSFLNVRVIRKGADSNFQYYMFKRLNTGGEPLSEQEVRNCTIRLLDPFFNDFIMELSRVGDFKSCTETLSDDKVSKLGRAELVLRFFAFKNDFQSFRHDIGDFLTDYMEKVTAREPGHDLNLDRERDIFEAVFGLLNAALGAGTCQAYRDGSPSGAFSMHHFEAFSIATARLVARNAQIDPREFKIRAVDTKNDAALREHTVGGGKNSPGLYRDKFDFVEAKLRG